MINYEAEIKLNEKYLNDNLNDIKDEFLDIIINEKYSFHEVNKVYNFNKNKRKHIEKLLNIDFANNYLNFNNKKQINYFIEISAKIADTLIKNTNIKNDLDNALINKYIPLDDIKSLCDDLYFANDKFHPFNNIEKEILVYTNFSIIFKNSINKNDYTLINKIIYLSFKIDPFNYIYIDSPAAIKFFYTNNVLIHKNGIYNEILKLFIIQSIIYLFDINRTNRYESITTKEVPDFVTITKQVSNYKNPFNITVDVLNFRLNLYNSTDVNNGYIIKCNNYNIGSDEIISIVDFNQTYYAILNLYTGLINDIIIEDISSTSTLNKIDMSIFIKNNDYKIIDIYNFLTNEKIKQPINYYYDMLFSIILKNIPFKEINELKLHPIYIKHDDNKQINGFINNIPDILCDSLDYTVLNKFNDIIYDIYSMLSLKNINIRDYCLKVNKDCITIIEDMLSIVANYMKDSSFEALNYASISIKLKDYFANNKLVNITYFEENNSNYLNFTYRLRTYEHSADTITISISDTIKNNIYEMPYVMDYYDYTCLHITYKLHYGLQDKDINIKDYNIYNAILYYMLYDYLFKSCYYNSCNLLYLEKLQELYDKLSKYYIINRINTELKLKNYGNDLIPLHNTYYLDKENNKNKFINASISTHSINKLNNVFNIIESRVNELFNKYNIERGGNIGSK